MIDYAGKIALVTGGASGIGLAIARGLRARGARLVIADMVETTLDAAYHEFGSDAVTIRCDLAEPSAPAKLLDDAWRSFGRLDLVCSNAGIGHNRKIVKETFDDSVARLFNVNLMAGVRLAQAYFMRLTQEKAKGHILFTGSENSLSVPSAVKGRGLALYAASKHGILIAAEWLRDETADGPLSIHVLLPGAVYTPLISKMLPDPTKAPAILNLIMPERCAEIALKGMDLGLFYIPTQKHLFDDMMPRVDGIKTSLEKLGL